jgi:hypothetical protein
MRTVHHDLAGISAELLAVQLAQERNSSEINGLKAQMTELVKSHPGWKLANGCRLTVSDQSPNHS